MAITEPQQTWLEEITGSVSRKVEADETRNLKATALQSIRSEVGDLQMELTAQFTFDVKKNKGKEKTQHSIDKGGDQVEEFDVDEVKDGYWFVTDEEYKTPEGQKKADEALKRIMKGHESLEAMRKKLEAVTRKVKDPHTQVETEVRVFTDEEIGEELYKPLVRSRAMPETLVPDRFSETQKMLEGTYDAYQKQVDASGEEPGFFARAKGLLGATGSDTLGGDGQIVGVTEYLLDNLTSKATTLGVNSDNPSLMSHLGPLKDQQTSGNVLFEHVKNAPIDTGNVSNFMALSGMVEAVDMGITTFSKGKAIIKAKSDKSTEVQPLPAKPLAASVVGYISGTIEAGVRDGIKSIVNHDKAPLSNVPKSLAKAFATKANFTQLAGMLVAKEEEKGSEKEKEEKEKKQEKQIEKAIESLGKAIEDSFKACGLVDPVGPNAKGAFVKAVKAADVVQAIAKRNQGAVCSAFVQGASAAITAIKTELGQMDEQAASEVATKLSDIQKDAILAEMALLPGQDKHKDEEIKKLSEVEAEQNAEKYVGVIERKARDIEAANASLELAVKLVSGGAAALATLFEPLAAAGALVKFIANMKHMIDRASDAVAWLDNQKDLLKACSPYSQAAKNFTHNQRVHSVHYGINAGLELLKMAAAISGTTGMDMGAGKAAGTLLAGMSLVEGAIYKAKMKYDLEAGYKAFVKAAKNPKNRKAGLQGLIKNPTLAKYSIAWGAYEKKDPLAVHAISSAGLNEKDLEDEKAGLEKVVEYLQTRYPEDNVILRKLATVSWSPGKIELTLSCWTRTKAQAQRDADLAPKPDTARIERALLDALRAKTALDDAKEHLGEDHFADAHDTFMTLEKAFQDYIPKTNADQYHEAMRNVALAFAAAARKEAEAVNKARNAWTKEDLTSNWKPPAVTLDATSWRAIIDSAVQDAELIDRANGDAIANDLTLYDQASATVTQQPLKLTFKAAIEAVAALSPLFRTYRPQKTGNLPHADMLRITARFAALARAREEKLIKTRDDLFPLN